MAQAAWEKPTAVQPVTRVNVNRLKFLIGGGLILAAVAYLIITGTLTSAQYFMSVDDLVNNPAYVGKTVRITGAVDGSTIDYNSDTLLIQFTVANVPSQVTDLGEALHQAVTDTSATRMPIVIENTVKPELLQNEAQAIMTGTLGSDGIFHATELLLKCPSRFVEKGPSQGELVPDQQQQVEVGTGA